MSSIRTWHTYLGILIAPSVIFFALTGSLQLFGLHESHGGYRPPQLLENLSALHKDQVLTAHAHADEHADHATAPAPAPEPDEDAPPPLHTMLLKWFFLVVALALTASTLLGLWMGLTQIRRRRTGWWLLAIGVIVPVVLSVL